MKDQKTPVTKAKPEAEAKTEEPNPNLVGSDTPTCEPSKEKPELVADQAAFNAKEVAMAAEEEGVTAAEMLAASIEKLRVEHVALGGGMNTAHSKAITFASTALDMIRAL